MEINCEIQPTTKQQRKSNTIHYMFVTTKHSMPCHVANQRRRDKLSRSLPTPHLATGNFFNYNFCFNSFLPSVDLNLFQLIRDENSLLFFVQHFLNCFSIGTQRSMSFRVLKSKDNCDEMTGNDFLSYFPRPLKICCKTSQGM